VRHGRLRRDLQGNLLERLDILDLLDERQQHVEPGRERPAKLAKALDDPRLLLGHKLDDLCVCVSWVTLCGGSAAAAYGVGWQRAGTLSPTRRKTLVPCKHKQMDGRAWATYHRRGTLHRRTAPGGHCSRQQTTTHHTNRRHLRVPHWKIMMVIFPRGPPLSLSLSFLTSPCPHPFVQRWPPSCAGPW